MGKCLQVARHVASLNSPGHLCVGLTKQSDRAARGIGKRGIFDRSEQSTKSGQSTKQLCD